jgi:hypothetical protein
MQQHIMIIGQNFFYLTTQIIDACKQRGLHVSFIKNKPFYMNNTTQWLFQKFGRDIIDSYQIPDINKAIRKYGVPSTILVLNFQSLGKNTLDLLKTIAPESKFITYQWDNISDQWRSKFFNLSYGGKYGISDYLDQYHTIFSFSDHDKDFGTKKLMLYCREKLSEQNNHNDVIVCVGSYIRSRAILLPKLEKELLENHVVLTVHMYATLLGILKAAFNGDRKLLKYIKPYKIGEREKKNLYAKASLVLDLSDGSSGGTAHRVFEALGHNCRVLTRDVTITESEIYDPEHIFVLNLDDDGTYSKLAKFLAREPSLPPSQNANLLDVEQWLNEILK